MLWLSYAPNYLHAKYIVQQTVPIGNRTTIWNTFVDASLVFFHIQHLVKQMPVLSLWHACCSSYLMCSASHILWEVTDDVVYMSSKEDSDNHLKCIKGSIGSRSAWKF